jgi:hypothetical protein
MANSIKIAGTEELNALRRRIIRQYNLPGTNGEAHRITAADRDDLLKGVDELLSKIQALQEFSPDVEKESPF